MKKTLLLACWVCLSVHTIAAQIPVQVFAGHQGVEFNFLWNKYLDENKKVSIFNFTTFTVDYDDKGKNLYEIYQVGIYNITKTWGIAGGGRFTFGEFIPEAAISFQIQKKDFYFNLFPSVRYTPSLDEIGCSFFGFLLYTPKISDNWSFFNQLIFEPLFNADGHQFNYQFIRTGLDYKGLFQFGLAANFFQTGKSWDFEYNLGIFIRKELF